MPKYIEPQQQLIVEVEDQFIANSQLGFSDIQKSNDQQLNNLVTQNNESINNLIHSVDQSSRETI